MAAGLQYLHQPIGELSSIVQRDIKNSNILLDENRACICHLGLARQEARQNTTMTHSVGSSVIWIPEYIETGNKTNLKIAYSMTLVNQLLVDPFGEEEASTSFTSSAWFDSIVNAGRLGDITRCRTSSLWGGPGWCISSF
jgi:serine/threonine protein kinase